MKQTLFATVLLMSSAMFAQNATFTWNGSDYGAELTTINGVPTNQATGYGGSIDVVNGSFMWLLDLPESLGFPNNGFLDCETQISFATKQWGKRADGSTMNGTVAGDYYNVSGTTVCPLWNGTTVIEITEYHLFVAHRGCGHGYCRTWLVDTQESGFGQAVVE